MKQEELRACLESIAAYQAENMKQQALIADALTQTLKVLEKQHNVIGTLGVLWVINLIVLIVYVTMAT